MTITSKHVGKTHSICGRLSPIYLSKEASNQWDKWALDPCDGAVLALDGKKIVGFFRYNLICDTLCPYGTWIESKYRRLGVASKLWDKAIKKIKPNEVDVFASSREGHIFLMKMEKQYFHIVFNIHQNY